MPDKVLLYGQDEDAAVFLLETALRGAGIAVQLFRVSDGEQALAFLRHSGAYAKVPRPGFDPPRSQSSQDDGSRSPFGNAEQWRIALHWRRGLYFAFVSGRPQDLCP